LYYIACPTCKKKVNEEGGSFKCEKCNKLISVPVITLMTSLKLMDQTGSIYTSLFGEKAEKLLNVKAEEIKGYKDSQEDAKIKHIFDSVKYKTYEFGIVAKKPFITATQNEKMSYSILYFNDVNYDKENIKMLADLKVMATNLKL
jgi:replication factor A1